MARHHARLLPDWLGFQVINRRQVLLAAKTGVAAGLAWAAALPVAPNGLPILAPIGAVLVVQPTVYNTVSRAAQRVGGVVVGIVVALTVARIVPIEGFIVGAVAFVGLLVGFLLRLGPQGAVQVPVSALLVLVVGSVTPRYGWDRLYQTLIGAGIGAGVALLSPAAPAASSAMRSATGLIRDEADLLECIGTEVRSTWSPAEAVGWEGSASGLVDAAHHARGQLKAEQHAARWNARARRTGAELDQVEDALLSAERIATQVRALTRALAESSHRARPLPRTGGLLTVTAGATRALAVVADSDGDRSAMRVLADAVRQADEAFEVTLEQVQQIWRDDPADWLTFGLALAAIQRILAEVNRPLDRLPGTMPFGAS